MHFSTHQINCTLLTPRRDVYRVQTSSEATMCLTSPDLYSTQDETKCLDVYQLLLIFFMCTLYYNTIKDRTCQRMAAPRRDECYFCWLHIFSYSFPAVYLEYLISEAKQHIECIYFPKVMKCAEDCRQETGFFLFDSLHDFCFRG